MTYALKQAAQSYLTSLHISPLTSLTNWLSEQLNSRERKHVCLAITQQSSTSYVRKTLPGWLTDRQKAKKGEEEGTASAAEKAPMAIL